MKIEDTNKQVDLFINWLESKVANANPRIPDMWVIKIDNCDLTNEDINMISLLNNSTSDFISLLYKKGYNDFEVGSMDIIKYTEITYIKKYE